MDAKGPTRHRTIVLLLLLLPALLLGDSLFGGRHYTPYDLAEFLPAAAPLTKEQLAEIRAGANYDASEPPIWFAPELAMAREAVVAGKYPHWNAYVRGGAPLTASGILGLLDPLHWPAFLFRDPNAGMLYITYVLFALAGVLMYGLLGALGLAQSAALFGAVAYAWSGTLTANGHWYMRLEPLALLPGMLWALVALPRARGCRRALPTVGFAVAMSFAWSACFPPFAIPCTLLCGLFAAGTVVHTLRRDGAAAAAALALWLALAFGLGLALAGATLAQQFQFFPVSNRPVAPTLASASRFAFDPMGMLGYLLPAPFSHPTDRVLASTHSPLVYLLFSRADWETGALLRPDQNYNFSEYSVFPGALPLVLAALGLCGPGPRWRFLCGGALTALWLLASGTGPFRFAFLVPGIQAVPPYRFVGPACAFVAILAALGFDRLLRDGGRWAARTTALVAATVGISSLVWSSALNADAEAVEASWLARITDRYRPMAHSFDPNLTPEMVTEPLVRKALFTGADDDGQPVDLLARGRERLQDELDRGGMGLTLAGAFVLAVALLAQRRGMPRWLAGAAVLATGAELWYHGALLNRGRELPFAVDTPVHQFLRERQREAEPRGGITVARASVAGDESMHMPPGPLLQDRVRDLQFYSYVDSHSTEPFRSIYGDSFLYRDYLPKVLPDDERLALPWWDAVGVRYLVSPRPLQHAGTRVGPEIDGPGGQYYVYERATALPRAWVVPRLRHVADDRAMVAAAVASDFEPRDHALVTDAEAARLPVLPPDPEAARREVTFRFEDKKRLVVTVSAGKRGYLVLADTFLPGWSATIDGFEVPIARGNVYQRIVPLPERECAINFRYRTPGLVAGLIVSGSAVGFSVVLLAVARFVRRRSRNGKPQP